MISGSDHPPSSVHLSWTCELVGRNSNPSFSQGLSIFAVPGSFFAAASVDICSTVVLVLRIVLLPTTVLMGGWNASENDTAVASSAARMVLLSNIMIELIWFDLILKYCILSPLFSISNSFNVSSDKQTTDNCAHQYVVSDVDIRYGTFVRLIDSLTVSPRREKEFSLVHETHRRNIARSGS